MSEIKDIYVIMKALKKELISEFLEDLKRYYAEYAFESEVDEKAFVKLIEKWEKKKNEL